MEEEFKCEYCKNNYNSKSNLFDHLTVSGPQTCKNKYEKKVLEDIDIPKPALRIDLTGFLSFFKKFEF